MWPFVVSLLFLYVMVKLFLQGGYVITLKDSLPELYVVSLLLSLLKGRVRKVCSAIAFAVMSTLAIIEVFLTAHFKLNLMGDVIRLMMETNASESSQFLDVFVLQCDTLKYVCLYAASTIMYCVSSRMVHYFSIQQSAWRQYLQVTLLLCVVAQFIYSGWMGAQYHFVNLVLSKNVYEFELRYMRGEGRGGCGAKTPVSRLLCGTRLYYLSTKQCDEILETSKGVYIDSCQHISPNIMLFIGESFIKRHAQIYGYKLNTTPFLQHEAARGNLVVMDDAMTIATQTSEVFKNMLSMHSVDQPGTWTNAPMVMQLMKLAGYRVSFITNQFAVDDHKVWANVGGFFLRDSRVSRLLLDYQSSQHYVYDEGLLSELDDAILADTINMNIFHVRGQHVAFDLGFPQDRAHFTWRDYAHRKELSQEQKQTVADYDNCTLYQDSICGELFKRYSNRDMVMVFVSDHGENVYDDGHTLGRVHNDFSRAMLESQYEIPMWIWYSPVYEQLHPDMVEKIKKASHRPFQIDDLPHLILELAGVDCKYYDASRSLINDKFNAARKRVH